MDNLNIVLANLVREVARFEKLSDGYISTLEKRKIARAETLAKEALKRKFIEENAPKVQTLWELVTTKYGRTH